MKAIQGKPCCNQAHMGWVENQSARFQRQYDKVVGTAIRTPNTTSSRRFPALIFFKSYVGIIAFHLLFLNLPIMSCSNEWFSPSLRKSEHICGASRMFARWIPASLSLRKDDFLLSPIII